MAKRFKLKLSRVIPSFQSCRSKDPSSLPSNPVPSFCRLSPVNPNNLHFPPPLSPLPPPKPHHSSFKRHVSSAFTSIGCGCGSRFVLSETEHTRSPPTPDFHWEKQEKWHVVAKIYDDVSPRKKIYNSSASDNDDVLFPPLSLPTKTKRGKRHSRKKKTTPRKRLSTSSPESGLFSSEYYDNDDEKHEVRNEEETETLVSSSRSFSTDMSSRESPLRASRKKVKKPSKRCAKGRRKSVEMTSPARLSRFQWLIPCTVEGKVRESFAVVKKSEDPYEDFKRSMIEMILEKQMFEERDLEQLLHCFLSLNSRNHHGVIVQAFSEIWTALFSRRSIACRSSVSR